MPPKKILIIDDEPAIQMLYNEEFVDAGYTVASAYNGEEGLAAFTDNPPDLVILPCRWRPRYSSGSWCWAAPPSS